MATVDLTVDLPPDLLEQANRAGLLTSQVVAGLVVAELRRRQVERLFAIADKLAALDELPLDEAAIEEEIRAARAEREDRESGLSLTP